MHKYNILYLKDFVNNSVNVNKITNVYKKPLYRFGTRNFKLNSVLWRMYQTVTFLGIECIHFVARHISQRIT